MPCLIGAAQGVEPMGKARLIGNQAAYIPNAKADMRRRKKMYQRGREIAERDPKETRAQRRELRELERMKMEQLGKAGC